MKRKAAVAAGHGLARGPQGHGLARRARTPARPAAAGPAPVPNAVGSWRTDPAPLALVLSSSPSFYLPNNTTVYTFAWMRFRRAGQQGPIRTPTAALKRSIKTVTG